MQIRDIITEQIHYVRPGELRGSYTDRQMVDMGFSKTSRGVWYIDQRRWDELIRNGTLREGDVIRTKFATKQAQQARDQYQRQPDIADSIPLYDPKRGMAVLPQHASDDAEPFDRFYADAKSERISRIIGVTRGGKKIVTSTWMAPVETVSKVADAYNRGGFSDVPMSRVPIRGYDDITEAREGVMRLIKKIVPDWPDYVIKDMLYLKIESPEVLADKIHHVRALASEIKPGSWRLHQKMPITFDMLSPKTRYQMKTKRQFGARNPFLVPRDTERSEDAEAVIRAKGIENLPPVIMIKTPQGLELWEGWHRTMAAFRLHPKGFKINAWIAEPGSTP
jgi:hypothetical protein